MTWQNNIGPSREIQHPPWSLSLPSILLRCRPAMAAAAALRRISAVLLLLLHISTSTVSIGVNYGTLGNNLRPPAEVANFIKTQTTFDRVKIFDANPDILRAFAGTGILVTVTIGNGDIPRLTDPAAAQQWVAANIVPFHPQTRINYIAVGNEVLLITRDLVPQLVPAMRSLQQALVQAGITDIKVTTPQALILQTSNPPSAGRFFPADAQALFTPLLQFLRETKAPFMMNPYPYFGMSSPKQLNFALFRPNPGLYDKFTRITYTNMFVANMDAVYSAMKAIGFADVDIVVGETGWPTRCDGNPICSPDNAAHYNRHLINLVKSGEGTPLMPNRRFEAYLFGLFNENVKPGPEAERNWGLFQPDFTPVYDVPIIMRNGRRRSGRRGGRGRPRPRPRPVVASSGKKWCVPKPDAANDALQNNIDYICSLNTVDCRPVQPGGVCFQPNDVRSHAAYLMNSYYQTAGRNDFNCDFRSTAVIATVDPSYGGCRYIA
ncbi:glucan endo-1,3-beta-glucosidase [Momordica charantia]|uniref:glucan endo-1,3-beta-D-glucosidase n=1 Tax=Momordica charantia TaxID=3673 RepID=A0A6J1CBA1_MOMCH|nr:glucan endo-1,3-beta-glucosidase [Momordica charantia]